MVISVYIITFDHHESPYIFLQDKNQKQSL